MAAISKPFFVVPLDLGTITTGNEQTSYPASNLNRQKAIGLIWKSTGNTNLWVRGNFGSSKSMDFMSLIAANALAGTNIRLRIGSTQAEVDGTAPYDSGALSLISPSITREDGLYHSHLELPSITTGQWFRIDITGHTGDFRAANLVLGRKVTPSRYYNLDYSFGVDDLGSLDFARWGVTDEEPGRIQRTIEFTTAWQTEDEYEINFRPMLEKLGRTGFVFLAFDPTSSAYRQARTYLGVLSKPPFAKGTRKARNFTMDWILRSVI